MALAFIFANSHIPTEAWRGFCLGIGIQAEQVSHRSQHVLIRYEAVHNNALGAAMADLLCRKNPPLLVDPILENIKDPVHTRGVLNSSIVNAQPSCPVWSHSTPPEQSGRNSHHNISDNTVISFRIGFSVFVECNGRVGENVH